MLWNAEKIEQALSYLEGCNERLLDEVVRLIRDYTNDEYDREYIRIVAGSWLIHFSHHLFVAYDSQKNSVTVENEQIHPCDNIPAFGDVSDYRWDDPYLHNHLRKMVRHVLSTGRIKEEWLAESVNIRNRLGLMERAKKIFYWCMGVGAKKALLVRSGIRSKLDIIRLLSKRHLGIAVSDMKYSCNFHHQLDKHWRVARSAQITNIDDYESLFYMLLPIYVPVILLEGFVEYRSWVLSKIPSRPKIVFSSGSIHNHSEFCFAIAEWKRKGTRLLYMQHGGGYGIERCLVFEGLESSLADVYYTYGWKNDKPNTIPLSPPWLRVSEDADSEFVLLNCLDVPGELYRIQFAPIANLRDILHQNTYKFLSAIGVGVPIKIRPYPHDYHTGFLEGMKEAVPRAVISSSKSSMYDYSESRFVVHNYIGTSWLETLSNNIPTICLYDPESTHRFTTHAQPFIDELERVGILHRNGDSAGRFVADIYNDPYDWWQRSEVQAAKDKFVAQYANFSHNWPKQWEQELETQISISS